MTEDAPSPELSRIPEVRFRELDPLFSDLYLLLELSGATPYPTPHRVLLQNQWKEIGGEVHEAAGVIAQAIEAEIIDPEQLLAESALSAGRLANDRCDNMDSLWACAGILEELHCSVLPRAPTELRALRSSIVSPADEQACHRLYSELIRITETEVYGESLFALARFFNISGESDRREPPTVIAYALSSNASYSFGAASNAVITLGIHPDQSAEDLFCVLVHEWLHHTFDSTPVEGLVAEGSWALVEEALITAASNAWLLQETTGNLPRKEWYDDCEVHKLAAEIYPVLESAIRSNKTVVDVIEEIAKQLEASSPASL